MLTVFLQYQTQSQLWPIIQTKLVWMLQLAKFFKILIVKPIFINTIINIDVNNK